MLKNILRDKIGGFNFKTENDRMSFKLKGELKLTAEKNGEIFYYDEGHNVVTIWAKHATMHLLTSESYSTHGTVFNEDGSELVYSSRSIDDADHTIGFKNVDGTLISGEQYLGNNDKYYDTGMQQYKHFNKPANLSVNNAIGDSNSGFIHPFFPTKMAFGTGIEYKNWDSVVAAGRAGDSEDITSYVHAKNGAWSESTFNNMIDNPKNYYSNKFDSESRNLIQSRTVNDVYSGVLPGNPPEETDFGIPGIIKDATFNDINENDNSKLMDVDGKKFAKESYRGIGRPSFVYATRNRFMQDGTEVKLEQGSTSGTESLESKVTFTVVLPEQPNGEFYPYNGYTLKIAGLFCDARMLLGNKVPIGDFVTTPTETDSSSQEFSNYNKMPGGILWAKRKIAPIFKSHDVRITAQWTIYLP